MDCVLDAYNDYLVFLGRSPANNIDRHMFYAMRRVIDGKTGFLFGGVAPFVVGVLARRRGLMVEASLLPPYDKEAMIGLSERRLQRLVVSMTTFHKTYSLKYPGIYCQFGHAVFAEDNPGGCPIMKLEVYDDSYH